MGQSIEKYREGNGGRAPSSVVVYRDGVRGASDYASAGREGEAVAAAIRSATGMGSDLLLSQLENMLSHMDSLSFAFQDIFNDHLFQRI